jgi:hypothetical protein
MYLTYILNMVLRLVTEAGYSSQKAGIRVTLYEVCCLEYRLRYSALSKTHSIFVFSFGMAYNRDIYTFFHKMSQGSNSIRHLLIETVIMISHSKPSHHNSSSSSPSSSSS